VEIYTRLGFSDMHKGTLIPDPDMNKNDYTETVEGMHGMMWA
jgi:hypothetical protein